MNNGIYQAGQRLRKIREELGLTLKDVEKLSGCIAEKTQIMDYFITAGRLSQVENSNSLPSLYKLATLGFIYKLPCTEMFRIYGIDIPTAEEAVPAAGPSSPPFRPKRLPCPNC
jgi:transcriptional regulator with XRE-family HTH domain